MRDARDDCVMVRGTEPRPGCKKSSARGLIELLPTSTIPHFSFTCRHPPSVPLRHSRSLQKPHLILLSVPSKAGASTVPPFNRLYPTLVSRNFPCSLRPSHFSVPQFRFGQLPSKDQPRDSGFPTPSMQAFLQLLGRARGCFAPASFIL